MSTYDESAYSTERVAEAAKAAGYDCIEDCVAKLATQGYNLTMIADHLELSHQPFWAFWRVWCKRNAVPLRLGEVEDNA